eukprot:Pgem_evm1s9162
MTRTIKKTVGEQTKKEYCEYPGCGKVYASKHACRLHYRIKHKKTLDDLGKTEPPKTEEINNANNNNGSVNNLSRATKSHSTNNLSSQANGILDSNNLVDDHNGKYPVYTPYQQPNYSHLADDKNRRYSNDSAYSTTSVEESDSGAEEYKYHTPAHPMPPRKASYPYAHTQLNGGYNNAYPNNTWSYDYDYEKRSNSISHTPNYDYY